MPPITYEELLKKNQQKKDLYSQRGKAPLKDFQSAFSRALRRCKPGKIDLNKAKAFADDMLKLTRDPAAREEYSYQEKRQQMFHPEEPKRPLQLVNRNTIENSLSNLEELGDFLGRKVKGENTNVYNYILSAAYQSGPEDSYILQTGFELYNKTLGLGLPMEQLRQGEEYRSTQEEKNARKKRREDLQKEQEEREKVYGEKLKDVATYRQNKAKESKAADRREAEELAEKTRKQREEDERKQRELEQKQHQAELKEKARQTQLRNQEAMRTGIKQSIQVYRDTTAAPETRKMSMAMAAAFEAELDRVGNSGEVPIDQDRVKKDMDQFFHSAEFAIAEANGSLGDLTALEPHQIRSRITAREQEVQRDHPEGKQADLGRVKRIWQQMDSTWRIKSNSAEFEAAKNAMREIYDKGKPATRAENYLAAQTVKRYVAKNINAARSATGKNRMAISLAFLKQTMTPAAFQAYCSSLNVQRQNEIPHTIGQDGIQYDRTSDRYIDPREIGTVNEVYNETRERIGKLSQEKNGQKPDPRDLAMLTALSRMREKGDGSQVVEKSALEAEIKKVQQDPRFRRAMERDSAEELINKAWYGGLGKMEEYDAPAPTGPQAKEPDQPNVQQL